MYCILITRAVLEGFGYWLQEPIEIPRSDPQSLNEDVLEIELEK